MVTVNNAFKFMLLTLYLLHFSPQLYWIIHIVRAYWFLNEHGKENMKANKAEEEEKMDKNKANHPKGFFMAPMNI